MLSEQTLFIIFILHFSIVLYKCILDKSLGEHKRLKCKKTFLNSSVCVCVCVYILGVGID